MEMMNMSNAPDVFENHGLLFLIGLVVAPSWTLFLASQIKLPQPVMWLAVFYAPDYSLLVIAFYRGYYIKNWLLVLCLIYAIMYRDLSRFLREKESRLQMQNHQSHSNQQELYNVVTILAHIAPPLSGSGSSFLQDKLNTILDVTNAKRLNSMQLTNLKNELESSLDAITDELDTRGVNRVNPVYDDDVIAHESCILCMEHPPVIVGNPCRHNLFCEKCFENVQDQDDQSAFSKCFICRTPLISWDSIYNSKKQLGHNNFIMNRVKSSDYHANGVMNAQSEMLKLGEHMKQHPELYEKLSKNSSSSYVH